MIRLVSVPVVGNVSVPMAYPEVVRPCQFWHTCVPRGECISRSLWWNISSCFQNL